jgi:hypothetical protein
MIGNEQCGSVFVCSGAASWLMVAAGALTALHVVGLNLQPLLAVGGVSGIIVGLSAQTIMANMLSGINLVRFLPCPVSDPVSKPLDISSQFSPQFSRLSACVSSVSKPSL